MAGKEEKLHIAFEIGLILKSVGAFLEILGGVLTFLVTKFYIIDTALSLTQEELIQDPRDIISNYLISLANNLSVSSQHFLALYLFTHGIIKMLIIIGLFQKKMWAYPGAIGIFGMFIVYQLYRYTNTHSPWLLLLTAFDLLIVWLITQEYFSIKKLH